MFYVKKIYTNIFIIFSKQTRTIKQLKKSQIVLKYLLGYVQKNEDIPISILQHVLLSYNKV